MQKHKKEKRSHNLTLHPEVWVWAQEVARSRGMSVSAWVGWRVIQAYEDLRRDRRGPKHD